MVDYVIKNTIRGNKLTGEIIIPEKHRKYLKTSEFFVYYDAKVSTNPSIVNIPLLATILPLAWLTGSDIQVDEIDKRFKESMDKLQKHFKKIYPLGPFTTKIKTEKIVDNKIGDLNSETQTALLFSGGVDSTYSMVTNLVHKPRLLMIWGIDNYAYPENKEQWDYVYSTYSDQAERLGLPINLVRTNACQILDNKRINHNFHKIIYEGSIRALIQHSLILLPLMAPLSIGRFNKLLIASSAGAQHDYMNNPWGSSPTIDELILWADLDVKHDGEVDRTEKISGSVKTFLEKNQLFLKVCLKKLERPELNDCECEKCFRTIMTLILSGVDPNRCGFKVDSSTFKTMKKYLSRPMRGGVIDYSLAPIQKVVSPGFESDIEGSKEFFEWYRNYRLKSRGSLERFRKIYHLLPYPFAKALDVIYRKLGFHIHEKGAQKKY